MSAVFTPQRKKIDVELDHRMGATGIFAAKDRVEPAAAADIAAIPGVSLMWGGVFG